MKKIKRHGNFPDVRWLNYNAGLKNHIKNIKGNWRNGAPLTNPDNNPRMHLFPYRYAIQNDALDECRVFRWSRGAGNHALPYTGLIIQPATGDGNITSSCNS
jgi:hypothetical protein